MFTLLTVVSFLAMVTGWFMLLWISRVFPHDLKQCTVGQLVLVAVYLFMFIGGSCAFAFSMFSILIRSVKIVWIGSH